MEIEEYDARTHGSYRFRHIDVDGTEHGFHGAFHEVRQDERIVQTLRDDARAPGGHSGRRYEDRQRAASGALAQDARPDREGARGQGSPRSRRSEEGPTVTTTRLPRPDYFNHPLMAPDAHLVTDGKPFPA